jgi:hypothetical protein
MKMPPPPRQLGPHGTKLWNSIQENGSSYSSPEQVEQLMQACAAVDRAEELAAAVAKHGVIVAGHLNPIVREELKCRTFVAKTLARLCEW